MDALKFAKPTPKRKPLKPGQHRWSYLRARRPRRLDKPTSDQARLSWLHEQECLLLSFDPEHRCSGRMEACHEGPRPGVSMKCPDSETVPMCTDAHGQWQEHRGWFRGWPKAKRRGWMNDRIAEVTARYLAHGGRRG